MNALFTPRLTSRLLMLAALSSLAACSSVGDLLEPEKIDYKSVGKTNKGVKLDVPPDLTPLKGEGRYNLDNARGTATASSYSPDRPSNSSATPVTVVEKVAPAANADAGIRVERAGSQRWLVSKQSPEVLWPRLKDFWIESGFLLEIEKPDTGIMETDWAENRAKIPQDFIRNSIGKVFDSLYSTGERDKFRTRLERTPDGGTEIYISHRGAIEVLTGQMKEKSMWTSRPSEPELEAEFLSRVMAALGSDAKVAKKEVNTAKPAALRARLVKEAAGGYVEVDESFDRAWRRVGLALDRVGFTVEDRDRTRGLYFVRYVDQGSDAEKKSGFFSGWFGSKDDKKSAARYRIMLKTAGEASRVSVLDEQGAAVANANAERILSLLNDQLK